MELNRGSVKGMIFRVLTLLLLCGDNFDFSPYSSQIATFSFLFLNIRFCRFISVGRTIFVTPFSSVHLPHLAVNCQTLQWSCLCSRLASLNLFSLFTLELFFRHIHLSPLPLPLPLPPLRMAPSSAFVFRCHLFCAFFYAFAS